MRKYVYTWPGDGTVPSTLPNRTFGVAGHTFRWMRSAHAVVDTVEQAGDII